MPGQPRLAAPGAFRYVMGWGLEKARVFQSDIDRRDFLDRLAKLCYDGVG